MKIQMKWLLGLLLIPVLTQAQDVDFQKNLKQHITILASDKYEGRETGTPGEKLSYKYIAKQFKEMGLEPMGTDGYLQPFQFTIGRSVGKNNTLSVNGKRLKLNFDFISMPYYFKGEAKGTVVNVEIGRAHV